MAPLRLASALVACLSLVSAFPAVESFVKRQVAINTTPFDAKQQYVSNKGANRFIAPGPNDKRSPCPGLNVLANHGYIPRNGYVTVLEIEKALPQVYGISDDVASVLALVLFGASDPKGNSYNIGGFPSSMTGFQAIQMEDLAMIMPIDSPRPIQQICDGYKNTDGAKYVTKDQLSQLGPSIDALFFRAMGNKSAEFPEGSFDISSAYPFLAMQPNKDGKTFTFTQYHGRIPDNWYTRNLLDPYTAATLASDSVEILINQGLASTLPSDYSGVDMLALTKGVYSNADLKDPVTNVCFLSQAIAVTFPAIAQLPSVSSTTRQNVASAIRDFSKGFASVPCAKTMTSMDLVMLSNVLGIAGL